MENGLEVRVIIVHYVHVWKYQKTGLIYKIINTYDPISNDVVEQSKMYWMSLIPLMNISNLYSL